MFRALAANLVAHERIETTDAKAKELRGIVERIIGKAIRLGPIAYTAQDQLGNADKARRLAAQRHLARFLQRFAMTQDGDTTKQVDLLDKVFVDLAKRFQNRPGGYTRIIKLGPRAGDNAPMSIIEFVSGDVSAPAENAATAG